MLPRLFLQTATGFVTSHVSGFSFHSLIKSCTSLAFLLNTRISLKTLSLNLAYGAGCSSGEVFSSLITMTRNRFKRNEDLQSIHHYIHDTRNYIIFPIKKFRDEISHYNIFTGDLMNGLTCGSSQNGYVITVNLY